MSQIAEASEGFIYLVSVTGVTGARAEVSNRVEGLVETLKATTDKPVAVGFGVSKPEHVKQLVSLGADGVIVGSAFVRALGESGQPGEARQGAKGCDGKVRRVPAVSRPKHDGNESAFVGNLKK